MGGKSSLRDALRVAAGERFRLEDHDPSDFHGWDKEHAKAETERQLARLSDMQDRLWAEAKHPVLVVLQGIDASGKDGAIRHVMTAFNPQGCQVSSFKVPTAEEAAHDFLWRIHKRVPGKGEIGVFNRSHYDTGTTIVKFFLNISSEEQRERLQERYDNPKKRWKFSIGDLDERALWDDYMAAYQDALAKTSTGAAPWYVIPANRNWFRDLAIASILADTLADLNPDYPKPDDLPPSLVVK
jgi:polyphosphate kinase 2 (PPK2 family)